MGAPSREVSWEKGIMGRGRLEGQARQPFKKRWMQIFAIEDTLVEAIWKW